MSNLVKSALIVHVFNPTQHLFVQIKVLELSIENRSLSLAVQGEVNLSSVALDGDVVPVLSVQQVSQHHCGHPIGVMDSATPWQKSRKTRPVIVDRMIDRTIER